MAQNDAEFGRAYAHNQIARQQNPLRKLIKHFYVARILRHVRGLAIDMGCGAGQILERLPKGSLGIELNPYLVDALRKRNLRVRLADTSKGDFHLDDIKPNEFQSLVLSHVLEHFENADTALRSLLANCAKAGISNVIIVVPGQVGYRSDPTHKTFVTEEYLKAKGLSQCEGFGISHLSYFPGNMRLLGNLFIYHELMIVYRLEHSPPQTAGLPVEGI